MTQAATDAGAAPAPIPLSIFSPAGVVPVAASVKRAAKRLKQLGFAPQVDASALARHQRFAGDDDTRLQAIQRMCALDGGVALATRGGYGLSRLLDRIDWAQVARSVERGVSWVGHSDLTALHLAALAHKASGPQKVGEGHTAGFWAGPMACGDFGRDDSPEGGDDVTQDCFVEAMQGLLEALGFRSGAGFDGLDVSGRLWGGNLSMVQALLGTPHFPRIKGGILFLEDVNEHPYRIERALLQLHQAGVLAQQKAVLLGEFTEYKKSPLDKGYKLSTVVDYLRSQVKVPILTGLPFGHVPTKLCLPVGRQTQLMVQGRDALMLW
jgi:muramoyltetrapeptide carboxypeptidase